MTVTRSSCPAKLNLTLAVTGRRDDGYHMLRSVFVRTALQDDLAVEPATEPGPDLISISGDHVVPAEENLVLRAAQSLRASVPARLPALRFTLHKRIPVAAGLAGGSSDAATALSLAAASWGLAMDRQQLLGLALRLGADVPFFVAGHGAALVDGIGDGIEPLPLPSTAAGLLLVTPRHRLATATVFAELDSRSIEPFAADEATELLVAALRSGIDGTALAGLASALRDANDLWAPAARRSEQLAAARGDLEASLQRPMLLSGSGPTLFAIYPSQQAAASAAATLELDRTAALAGAVVNVTTTAEGDQG